jgi:hypothetical protein
VRVVAGLTAVVVAVGVVLPIPDAMSAPTKCAAGEAEDTFTGVCLPVPPTAVIEETTAEVGGLPEVDGVPCTGHNSYECLGLAEESEADGPTPTPHASVTHSP